MGSKVPEITQGSLTVSHDGVGVSSQLGWPSQRLKEIHTILV